MIPIQVIIALLATHFVADFLYQSDWMAQNKSKNNKALLSHTFLYSWIFLICIIFPPIKMPFIQACYFGLITFICHTVQDYITSRINTRLWEKKKVHWFFVSIGFDQLLHYTQLILTYYFLII